MLGQSASPNASVNRRAFTLIELLVVIAIISLLAAILFPVFATAREKARQTTCASNEKQIGLAFMQYSQDYDEMLPFPLPDSYSGWAGLGWAGAIYPYVKATGAFTCPDDTTVPNQMGTYEVSYSLNGFLSTPVNAASGANTIGSALSKVALPTRVILLVETKGTFAPVTSPTETVPAQGIHSAIDVGDNMIVEDISNNYKCTTSGSTWTWMQHGSPADVPVATYTGDHGLVGVHSGGSNIVFCDGHVKWLPSTAISRYTSPSSPSSYVAFYPPS